MSVLAIELNDAGVRAAHSNEDTLVPVDGDATASAGFALIEKRAIVTGRAAERALCGNRVHHRFWDRLDVEPIDTRDPRAPSRAEVAFEHLKHIVTTVDPPFDDLVMAVPPIYEAPGLGLLVGMARELDLPLRAFVASPAALDLSALDPGTIVVVELALHRAVVSIVETSDEGQVLSETRISPNVGAFAFRRQWIKAIGAEFVRRTRFDPLHDAVTEQQVHDRLPSLLETLQRGSDEDLIVETTTGTHRLIVTDQLLADAGRGLVFELCGAVQALATSRRLSGVVLTHDAKQVPGLRRALQRQIHVPVHETPPGAAARSLARAWPDRFEPVDAAGVAYHQRVIAAAGAGHSRGGA